MNDSSKAGWLLFIVIVIAMFISDNQNPHDPYPSTCASVADARSISVEC